MKRTLWFGIVLCLIASPASRAGADESVEILAPSGGRVWVYLPTSEGAPASLPCVIVPPAGSRLFHGIRLTEGDRAEHWPYVPRGFAVISFDISGELENTDDPKLTRNAVARFLAADCGVLDAQAALAVALKRYPQIDRARLYAAGHSSAATLALQLAASDLPIRGCVALAPIGDLRERLGSDGLLWLDQVLPGSGSKLAAKSPILLGRKIRCPVFLFHALDDDNVPPPTVRRLKEALQSSGVTVEYSTAATGGHYDSMIKEGLPSAVKWLSNLDQRRKEPNKPPAR